MRPHVALDVILSHFDVAYGALDLLVPIGGDGSAAGAYIGKVGEVGGVAEVHSVSIGLYTYSECFNYFIFYIH